MNKLQCHYPEGKEKVRRVCLLFGISARKLEELAINLGYKYEQQPVVTAVFPFRVVIEIPDSEQVNLNSDWRRDFPELAE